MVNRKHNSGYTKVVTQKWLHKSGYTKVVTQKWLGQFSYICTDLGSRVPATFYDVNSMILELLVDVMGEKWLSFG